MCSRRLAAAVAFSVLTVAAVSWGQHRQIERRPGGNRVWEVMNAVELTKEQKVSRLKDLVRTDDLMWPALYRLDTLDSREAMDLAVKMFRAEGAGRETKLRLGHFLLGNNRPRLEAFPTGLVDEFAAYLVDAVLDGGEAEFCRKLPGHPTTPVGEFAYLASDFDGYMGIDFAPFKDSRLVPVLVRCLDAPDNVWSDDQGDCIRGKPGESTGRNTARQQIPVALARLDDARAVEPLKRVLFDLPDVYGKMNAAYALARLLKQKEERAAIGKELLSKQELLWCRLSFGKGLVEAGDDTGVEFLAIKHAGGYGRLEYPDEILYMMNQRLAILKGFKSLKTETFVREALEYKPLRDLILFVPGSVKVAPYVRPAPRDDAEALERVAPRVIAVYRDLLDCVEVNGLRGVSASLEKIAGNTRSDRIRQMTKDSLQVLGTPR